MLKLSTMFKVLAVSALVMGFGLMVIGSDGPTPIQPLPEGDGADFDLKEQLTPTHEEPVTNITLTRPDTKGDYTGPDYINPADKQGGDDIGTAFDISGALPITTTGTTAGYINDYDEVCDYSGSTSPDVVYKYTPTANIMVHIHLCNSAYDTKLYVYENDEFTLVDCNDDYCPGYMSELFDVPMNLGNDYYIVVDGYGNNSGAYELYMEEVAIPVGRCCYGEPVECIDNTEAECAGLGGTWNGSLDCTAPCEAVPDNDECVDATPINTFPAEFDGNTAGATVDCPGVLDWNAIWYALELPYGSNNVNVDYCHSPDDVNCVAAVMYASCEDDCADYILYSSGAFVDCGDGYTTANLNFNGLVGPATYYLPVFTGDPDCISIEADFHLTISVEEVVVTAGDNCGDPLVVKLPDDMIDGPNNDEYINVNTTCNRVDDYNATCLGYYDGGEDIIYMLDVVAGDYDFTLTSNSSYVGMSIDDACPGDPTTCLYKATSSGSGVVISASLATGYFYLMIDTWPSPVCIPEFTLTISPGAGPQQGDSWELCNELGGEVVDEPFSTVGMTFDGPGGCMTGPNIWYCYTPTESGGATVSLCGSLYDTKLAVYDGSDPSTIMGCNDDAPCAKDRSLQSELAGLPFVAGNTYLIEVGGYSSASGTGILNIFFCPPPDNDNCQDVTPVTLVHGTPVTFTGDNTCATNQCASFPGGHTWHAITLSTTMDVTLDYCTNSPAWGNAWLNLGIGCPCTGFTVAAAFDFTTCGDGNVTMTWAGLEAGTYYYPVMLDPGNNSVGPYTIHVVGSTPSLLTVDPESIDFGIQSAGSMGSLPLTLGADGPADIAFSISYVYGDKGFGPGPWDNLSPTAVEKPDYSGPVNEPDENVYRQGGDVIAEATVIGALPYNDDGTTVGYIDDYDEACPFTGSTSPDVVYSFAPSADIVVDISLCDSYYDTKLYLYENTVTPGAPFACNDDECPGFMSALYELQLYGGNTYYIVIDGYGGASGDYVIDMNEYEEPEPFECPEGATVDPEPCAGDNYDDEVNGGCNSTVPVFGNISCGETVCGTSSTFLFQGSNYRDTDWYELDLASGGTLTYTGMAEFPFLMFIIDPGSGDCSDLAILSSITGNPGETKTLVAPDLPGGVYWLWMGPSVFDGYPCGADNGFWITADCPPQLDWLSADPEVDIVPAGGTLPITVSWDATGLETGTYNAALKITHDGRTETMVPCTIEIGEVSSSVLTVDPPEIDFGIQAAGSMGGLPLTLGADGDDDISFSISYAYPDKSVAPGTYDNLSTTGVEKPDYSGPVNEPDENVYRQGGDLISSATAIATDSYSNTGTTVGYNDDYDEVCPYTGSTSPDVVYSYVCTADNKQIDVDMLGSLYDTKIYIYENSWTPGSPHACNDDFYSDYVSALWDIDITNGNTYYIVVDGYGGGSGDYAIAVEVHDAAGPCIVTCPEGATVEPEPCAGDEYDDTVNGGCNSAVPVFGSISCGETICGTSSTFLFGGSNYRDTDWFKLELAEMGTLTYTGCAEFAFLMFLIDAGSEDCVDYAILSSITGNPCDTMTLVGVDLPAGVYWLWMGPSVFDGYPCGGDNDFWINADCPVPLDWLSASPEAGTVPAGGTLPITVNWDATNLEFGFVYNAALMIAHNGRTETVVPCTIEIGDAVPSDTLVLVPDTVSQMMENDIDGVDPNGYIYIGDDLGWVNPNLSSFTVNGSLAATGETIGEYPGLTAPIIKLTFDLSDFAVMYNTGLIWGCETRSYTVEGTDDGGAISAGDDFTYCGHTAGDLNRDGQIDISDLIMLVDFMFADGPPPEVLLTADIDGNGTIDISDLVAFVDYMFNDGAPPVQQ